MNDLERQKRRSNRQYMYALRPEHGLVLDELREALVAAGVLREEQNGPDVAYHSARIVFTAQGHIQLELDTTDQAIRLAELVNLGSAQASAETGDEQ